MIKKIIKKFLPPFVLNGYHFLLAFLAAIIYWFPSNKIKVIGVTGTNGKTTVVNMTSNVLEEGGYKVASVSSIKFKIGNKEWLNTLKMTMPGRFTIQKFLRRAVSAGCQYAVLEVSSEGIKQYRHKFIDFSIAVFTNLTPEHIESHKGFENYRIAKTELFKATKGVHIINIDDKNAEYFLQFPAVEKIGYSNQNNNYFIGIIEEKHKENFSLIEKQAINFNLKLMGDFNAYNALAAIAVGISQNIYLENCIKAVESIESIPGRMEIVIKNPFKVVVDYAVTPNAQEALYKTLKKNFPSSNLICVFGACGGGRDKWKRPELGKIAQKYCNEIILTNEDPFDENPHDILSQIESGFTHSNSNLEIPKYKKILDRRKAIRKALELANSGDVVAITGKGCEPQMVLAKGKKITWSDKNITKEEFNKLNK